MFSYVDVESPIPAGHPIRRVRKVVDQALAGMDDVFDVCTPKTGGGEDFRGKRLTNATHRSTTDPDAGFHAGDRASMVKRKRGKEPFGWAKAMGLMRGQRHRGRPRVQWQLRLAAAAYNVTLMIRMAGAAL